MVLYPIGTTPGCVFAAEILKKQGFSLTDHPSPEVTHLMLDVPSFDAEGNLRGGGKIDHTLQMLPSTITVIGGNLQHPDLQSYQALDLLQDPAYVAENAAITADCALRLIGPRMKAAFRDSPALVLGWGRIGKCLAQLLDGLGCPVTVAARKECDRGMLKALGVTTVDFETAEKTLGRFRLVFNTVPEMVLHKDPPKDCIAMDLASKRGIPGDSVIWARGLPGIYAPQSTGKLIAERIRINFEEG